MDAAAFEGQGRPIFLFVLNPAHCGSTAMAQFLLTSPLVAALNKKAEAHFLPEARGLLDAERWNPSRSTRWDELIPIWARAWSEIARADPSKRVMLDKSPPLMMRALELEQRFVGARFVVLMRDPYAWCATNRRRQALEPSPDDIEARARTWVERATMQRHNADQLSSVLPLSYEQFSDDPHGSSKSMLNFLPELRYLDPGVEIRVKRYDPAPISNHNDRQIAKLEQEAFQRISNVLLEDETLLDFFGYRLREDEEHIELRRRAGLPVIEMSSRKVESEEPAERIFVLNPGHCGSTILAQLLLTSPAAAHLQRRSEAHFLEEVRILLAEDRWALDPPMPWDQIKPIWAREWSRVARADSSKTIMIDKSPPLMVRAEEVEFEFPGARFILMMRDPYPWCVSHKGGKEPNPTPDQIEERARIWVTRADAQRDNASRLQRVMRTTYEAFTADPATLAGEIETFCPALGRLDPAIEVQVKRYPLSPIVNHNDRQMAQLEPEAFRRITAVLAGHEDLLDFFGYRPRGESELEVLKGA